jgi:thioredoxin 1
MYLYLSRGARTAAAFGSRSIQNARCMSAAVTTLSDLNAVDKFTQLNSKVCIYYTATWCGPCRQIKPIYEGLAETYSGTVALGKVDVDDNPEAAAAAQVTAVPTFVFYNNNTVVKTFSGADQNQLLASLKELNDQ